MKRLSFRLKSFLTVYFAVVLVVAVIFYGTSLFGAPQIVAPLCEFKDTLAGETARQKISLQNTTRQPLQLIGALVPCTLCGCASTEGLPVTIPPGQSESFFVLFKATTAGQFNTEIELYTDNPEQTIVRLQVRGTVKSGTTNQ